MLRRKDSTMNHVVTALPVFVLVLLQDDLFLCWLILALGAGAFLKVIRT